MTFIELLFACVVLGMVVSVIGIVMINLNKQASVQAQLNEAITQTTTASRMLLNAVSRAGIIGCKIIDRDLRLNDSIILSSKNKLIIEPTAMTVRYMHYPENNLLTKASDNQIDVSDHVHYQKNDVLIISDCWNAVLVKVDSVMTHSRGQRLILTTRLQAPFYQGASIGKLVVEQYHVKATGRMTRSGKSINALYVDDGQTDDELVAGIGRLQFMREANGVRLTLATDAYPNIRWNYYVAVPS